MLSQERQSTKSPATSVQSGSTRTPPVSNSQRAQSVASSITERDEKSSVSTEPRPLPSAQRKFAESNNSRSDTESERGTPPTRNLARQKSLSSDSDEQTPNRRPPPSSPSENSVRTPIQTKPKFAVQSLIRNVAKMGASDRSEHSDDSTTKKKSQTKYSPISNLIKVSARNIERGKSSVIPASVSQYLTNGKTKSQSVFEKVDLHTGSASYLGSGNFRNLEDCIRDCLSKDRYHRDWSHSSLKNLTRASVLEDYSYDGIISSNNHRHDYLHYLNNDNHHHHHHRSSYSLLHHHRHKSPKDLTLEEIRHINDELAKYGIPVFSHARSNSHQRPQTIGEILSACQLLSNNPTLNQHSNNPDAVRHVWDQISYYQPAMAPPAPPAPAYPPAPSGGSGALSRLFGAPAAPPPAPPAPFYPGAYPPAPVPPAAGGGGSSVLSKLFGGSAAAPPPPMQYNPGPSMMPPSYPPPPPPGGSGQNVLASLFGR